MTEQQNQPAAAKLAASSVAPPALTVRQEIWRIVWRSVFFFLLLLAVLIMWRGSAVFLYEGF